MNLPIGPTPLNLEAALGQSGQAGSTVPHGQAHWHDLRLSRVWKQLGVGGYECEWRGPCSLVPREHRCTRLGSPLQQWALGQ